MMGMANPMATIDEDQVERASAGPRGRWMTSKCQSKVTCSKEMLRVEAVSPYGVHLGLDWRDAHVDGRPRP